MAVASRGKLPTAKQFARLGAPFASAWFGGDLSALYAAVGEKAPDEQHRFCLLPYDRAGFCNQVFAALGGRFVPNSRAIEDYDGNHLSWLIRGLAAEAPRFVQLEEIFDRQPTAEEFGAARLTWPERSPSTSTPPWSARYTRRCRRSTSPPRRHQRRTPSSLRRPPSYQVRCLGTHRPLHPRRPGRSPRHDRRHPSPQRSQSPPAPRHSRPQPLRQSQPIPDTGASDGSG